MTLELDSLIKAVDSLKRSVDAAHDNMDSLGNDLKDTVRAGVIQNFEIAYELCWKFIQRWIRVNSPEDAENPRTRKELFRAAAAHGLIPDPTPWFEFGDARNLTSHTYDEGQAAAVYAAAGRFLPHAVELLKRLTERND